MVKKRSFRILTLPPSGSCLADAALPRFGCCEGPGTGNILGALWVKSGIEMPFEARFSGPKFHLISQRYGAGMYGGKNVAH